MTDATLTGFCMMCGASVTLVSRPVTLPGGQTVEETVCSQCSSPVLPDDAGAPAPAAVPPPPPAPRPNSDTAVTESAPIAETTAPPATAGDTAPPGQPAAAPAPHPPPEKTASAEGSTPPPTQPPPAPHAAPPQQAATPVSEEAVDDLWGDTSEPLAGLESDTLADVAGSMSSHGSSEAVDLAGMTITPGMMPEDMKAKMEASVQPPPSHGSLESSADDWFPTDTEPPSGAPAPETSAEAAFDAPAPAPAMPPPEAPAELFDDEPPAPSPPAAAATPEPIVPPEAPTAPAPEPPPAPSPPPASPAPPTPETTPPPPPVASAAVPAPERAAEPPLAPEPPAPTPEPAPPPPPMAAAPPEPAPSPAAGGPVVSGRVLVGEDTAFHREMLMDVIRESQFAADASAAENGQQLLTAYTELLQQNTPVGFIVLDVRMPILNGIHTAVALRALEDAFGVTDHPPIMFFTTVDLDENMRKVIQYVQPALYFNKSTGRTPDALAAALRDAYTQLTFGNGAPA